MGLDRPGTQFLSQSTGSLLDFPEDDGTLEGWMMMNDMGMN